MVEKQCSHAHSLLPHECTSVEGQDEEEEEVEEDVDDEEPGWVMLWDE